MSLDCLCCAGVSCDRCAFAIPVSIDVCQTLCLPSCVFAFGGGGADVLSELFGWNVSRRFL